MRPVGIHVGAIMLENEHFDTDALTGFLKQSSSWIASSSAMPKLNHTPLIIVAPNRYAHYKHVDATMARFDATGLDAFSRLLASEPGRLMDMMTYRKMAIPSSTRAQQGGKYNDAKCIALVIKYSRESGEVRALAHCSTPANGARNILSTL